MASMFQSIVSEIMAELRDEIRAELKAAMSGSLDTTAPIRSAKETPKLTRSELARRVYEQESGYRAPLRAEGAADGSTVVRRRRRRATRPSKAYALNNTRKNAPEPDMHHTALMVYRAIRKANGVATAREIEQSTGLKRKTVESSLWYLRNHDADGQRIDMNKRGAADRAIVQSVQNDAE